MQKFFLLFLSGIFLSPVIGNAVLLDDSSGYNPVPVQRISPQDDVPVGTVIPWPVNSALPGEGAGSQKWLPCDGSMVPSDSRFERLRRLIGNVLPLYNQPFQAGTNGMFLRGSLQAGATYNQKFNDQTEKHIHEQPKHTHPFDLKLLDAAVKGETEALFYNDEKRGSHGKIGAFPGEPFFNILQIDKAADKSPIMAESDRPIGSYFDGYIPEGADHIVSSDVSVRLEFSGGRHCIERGCVEWDKEGRCVREDCIRWGHCDSSYRTLSDTLTWSNLEDKIQITGKSSPAHDGSVFGNSDVSGFNNGLSGFSATFAVDKMDDSALQNTRLVNSKVDGTVDRNGGDRSYPGVDNRGQSDMGETAPAHIIVRYIIKALP